MDHPLCEWLVISDYSKILAPQQSPSMCCKYVFSKYVLHVHLCCIAFDLTVTSQLFIKVGCGVGIFKARATKFQNCQCLKYQMLSKEFHVYFGWKTEARTCIFSVVCRSVKIHLFQDRTMYSAKFSKKSDSNRYSRSTRSPRILRVGSAREQGLLDIAAPGSIPDSLKGNYLLWPFYMCNNWPAPTSQKYKTFEVEAVHRIYQRGATH